MQDRRRSNLKAYVIISRILNVGYDPAYRSLASTPGGWNSLSDHLNDRIQETPTPDSNQIRATPTGVVNDAGITPIPDTDLVRSSVSKDV